MKSLILSALFAVAFLAGCSQPETTETAPPTSTSSTEGAAPAATTMAKCAECNNELPSNELISHDGKMLCKKCIDSHGH